MPVFDALSGNLVLTVRGSSSDFRQVYDLDIALSWQSLFAVIQCLDKFGEVFDSLLFDPSKMKLY